MCVEIEIKVLIYFWCAVINFPDGTSATTYWTQIDGWVISHVVRAANNVFRLYCPTKTSRIHLIVTFGNVNIEADHLFIVSICVLRCNDSSFHIVEDRFYWDFPWLLHSVSNGRWTRKGIEGNSLYIYVYTCTYDWLLSSVPFLVHCVHCSSYCISKISV